MLSLLDTVDPVFGWSGISFRFPNSWKLTAGEVAEHFDRQIARMAATGSLIRRHRRNKKRVAIDDQK
jgi:hypothetical protein